MEIREAKTYTSHTRPVAQNAMASAHPLQNGSSLDDMPDTFSRDSYQPSDVSEQGPADQSNSLRAMAVKNGTFGRVAQPEFQFAGGPKGGPYKHDWNNGFHQNGRPEDADLRCNVTVVRRPKPKPQPVKVEKKLEPKRKPTPVPPNNNNITGGTVSAGTVARTNDAYPPNNPKNRKILQDNVTEASVLSAQNRNSDTRWLTWESMLANQKMESGSDMHYFNLGATGAAFHFDVDALVKYAGHNHDLITPEQMALVRRGYTFASAKPR